MEERNGKGRAARLGGEFDLRLERVGVHLPERVARLLGGLHRLLGVVVRLLVLLELEEAARDLVREPAGLRRRLGQLQLLLPAARTPEP